MIKKMRYKILNKAESDKVLVKIIETLLDPTVPTTSSSKERFEKGWEENVKAGDIIPRYFGKHKVNRLNGKFVIGFEKAYERKMLYSIVDDLTRKYLSKHDTICELGCGTGHNLVHIRESYPDKRYIGYDWTEASQKLLHANGMEGYNFDFFEPAGKLPPNAAVLTVAALEQTYTRFEQFLKWIRKQNPAVIVHIEPIPELLDRNNLLDYLSIKYMEKRKYLTGYYDTLCALENAGKIEILEARRSGIGSLYIDGYSIVVWRPI